MHTSMFLGKTDIAVATGTLVIMNYIRTDRKFLLYYKCEEHCSPFTNNTA